MDLREITDFEHLYESMEKCRRGVSWKDSVMSYTLNGIERNLKLEQALADGTYQPRKTKAFKITNPKPRDIISISFTDRVYQRSLNELGLSERKGNGRMPRSTERISEGVLQKVRNRRSLSAMRY